jgi:TonB family protein
MTQQGSDPARIPGTATPPGAGVQASASGTAPQHLKVPSVTRAVIEPPKFLPQLEPRGKVFFRNLADILFFRNPPAVVITAKPGRFWSDVFVDDRLSARALADSALLHVFLVVVIIGITETYFTWRPPELHDAFSHTKLTYYEVSEYLPEVNTSEKPKLTAPRKPARAGAPAAPADPTYAKQEIISVPPNPDNLKQTIVTPSQVRIDQDVPLPNIVTAQPPKATDVLQVANRPVPKLETPPEILAPKLKVAMAPPDIANGAVPKPVEALAVANRPGPKSLTPPEVDAPKLAIGTALPEVATGAVPAAAPAPIQVTNGRVRKNASAGSEVAAPTVKGSVAAPTIATNGTSQLPKPAATPTAASNSATNGVGNTPTSSQQIIALSTQPAPPTGTLNIPNGTRRGTFAAGPDGRPGASGAPATTVEKSAAPETGGAPSGIHVTGTGDASPHSGVVAAGTPHDPSPADGLRNRMIAMASGSPSIPAPRVQPEAANKTDADPTAKAVFGDKRYYKLTVNMPNLTSASGSWVIRFAELNPQAGQAQIALAAPIALSKSDPGYPPDLMKDKVEGTVILYAIIRADGSITDVKVINSVNERLDASAVAALHRWRFQPGSKANLPVDVEAVVHVPFKVKKLAF